MARLYCPSFFDHLEDEHPCWICGYEMRAHGYHFYCDHCGWDRPMSLYCLAEY